MSKVLIFKKKIDWTELEYGIHIPLEYHENFFCANNENLPKGEYRSIDLIWNGHIINAKLYNIEQKTASNILQIKYGHETNISKMFKAIFQRTYLNILKNRRLSQIEGEKRPLLNISDEDAEYLSIYSTDKPYVYEIECQTRIIDYYHQGVDDYLHEDNDTNLIEDENNLLTEEEILQFRVIRFIDLANQLKKAPQVNAGTPSYQSNKLKEDIKHHYDYTCQICSTQIKKTGWSQNLSKLKSFKYLDADTHHVKPLSQGGPDSPYNLLCVCPNCHRRLHSGQFNVMFSDGKYPICFDLFEMTRYSINFRDGHILESY